MKNAISVLESRITVLSSKMKMIEDEHVHETVKVELIKRWETEIEELTKVQKILSE